jgi:hypothetical protein
VKTQQEIPSPEQLRRGLQAYFDHHLAYGAYQSSVTGVRDTPFGPQQRQIVAREIAQARASAVPAAAFVRQLAGMASLASSADPLRQRKVAAEADRPTSRMLPEQVRQRFDALAAGTGIEKLAGDALGVADTIESRIEALDGDRAEIARTGRPLSSPIAGAVGDDTLFLGGATIAAGGMTMVGAAVVVVATAPVWAVGTVVFLGGAAIGLGGVLMMQGLEGPAVSDVPDGR